MTEQITVPKSAWDAVVEALQKSLCFVEAATKKADKSCEGDHWVLALYDDLEKHRKALTAANAVTSECSKVTSEYSEQQQAPLGHDGKGCNEVLRMAGKAYPRTCKACGLGPCKWKSAANAVQRPTDRDIAGENQQSTNEQCAANAVSESALVHVDWQDMYWKEKRRAEMWVAKYEKDIGLLEKAYPQATEPAGYKLVPVMPTEEQWGGLARDIMMWLDMDGRKTAGSLFKHLERCGTSIPQWLRDEPEMKNLDHVPSKGTRVTIIYRAMLAVAPEAK